MDSETRLETQDTSLRKQNPGGNCLLLVSPSYSFASLMTDLGTAISKGEAEGHRDGFRTHICREFFSLSAWMRRLLRARTWLPSAVVLLGSKIVSLSCALGAIAPKNSRVGRVRRKLTTITLA